MTKSNRWSRIRRITAWLTIVLIVGLIIGTLVCGILGSPYFFGMLFLSIAVPVVLWVFMWFTHLIHGESEQDLESKRGTEPDEPAP